MRRHPDFNPLTGARPISEEQTAHLLEEIVKSLVQSNDATVAFDLDSTLLYNSPRQALIMREYGDRHGVVALTQVQASHWDGWDAKVPMAAVGLSDEEIKQHFDAFRKYWFECFFTSEYCKVDEEIPGATRYANAVRETGCKVLYVTGRHEPMREGTIASFHNTGFPIPDGQDVQLMMKPTLDEHDDAFKKRAYEAVNRMGRLVAAFDNEPAHINGYFDHFPDARAVHMATDHSLREIKVREGIPSIRDFTPYSLKT